MLGRLWRGEEPLWKTYWIYGVCGGLLIQIMTLGISYLVAANINSLSAFDTEVISKGWLIFVLALGLVIIVSIWRSATVYSDKNNKKYWGGIAKILVILSIAGAGVELTQALNDKSNGTQPTTADGRLQLQATIAGANRDLPKMIDSVTRLERIDIRQNKFIYTFTLLNAINDKPQMQTALKRNIVTTLCNSSEERKILKGGINYEYNYFDAQNQYLFVVTITGDMCPN